MRQPTTNNLITRPPVIVIMGHIDHGKSTILDYIRKSNTVEKEAGGITQHILAYEIKHKFSDGSEKLMTFIDTPGHEAFCQMREHGTSVADIAILVVSSEEGVKPQTKEAYQCITSNNIPFVVAINKIDKPEANIEKTKQSLAKNNIFVEGYGGKIPVVEISAKTGKGIPELLDMILLMSDLEEFKGRLDSKAKGSVIESSIDIKKGIKATLIIKDGVLKKKMYVASGESIAPVRIMENFLGKNIEEAKFSSPINIIGWNSLPAVGKEFVSFDTKKEAQEYISLKKIDSLTEKEKVKNPSKQTLVQANNEKQIKILLVIKADTLGSLQAIRYQISNIESQKVLVNIVLAGIGNISENDIRTIGASTGSTSPVVVGFNTKVDSAANSLAERFGIEVKTFNIIYQLSEWIEDKVLALEPKLEVEEITGSTKILKIFNKSKNTQVVGGKVVKGILSVGDTIKIIRNENKIGEGKIKGLQSQKVKTNKVEEGSQCGISLDSKIEIVAGDFIESSKIVYSDAKKSFSQTKTKPDSLPTHPDSLKQASG